VLAVASIPAQQTASTSSAEIDPGRVETLAKKTLSREHIPGMSVSVITDGEIVFSRAYGLADVENNVPATPASEFRTASIAKPMTAIAAMQLAREGKLDLDAPVQQYCPAFPTKRSAAGKDWPVTTRELLAHRAGVRWYANDTEAKNAKHYDNLNQAIAVFGNDSLLFEPGTDFRYSSYGYVLWAARSREHRT
jgi:CubicO group peptidase (beta-lactamase class C family)